MRDTIFALSTVFGKSGIAVVRISGPKSFDILPSFGVKINNLIPRKAFHTKLFNIEKNSILDDVIILPFKSPDSFNGEDIIEFHLHGSVAVINDVLSELEKIEFLRMAEPGEFTKVAFYNGKMDLTRAEGLAELLNAETSIQRHIAQKQLSGELEGLYEKWRNSLIKILAQLEAFIDFPDDDIPEDVLKNSENLIQSLAAEISRYLEQSQRSEMIMHGINIVISGAPNVGKSSLMNLIAQKEVAIVSNVAGTTRDILQIKLNLEGFSVLLADTAGIRENTQDKIEQEGIKRAKSAMKEAGINVMVLDNLSSIKDSPKDHSQNTIIVINKSDLMLQKEVDKKIHDIVDELNISIENVISISAEHNKGIDLLLGAVMNMIKKEYGAAVDEPVITKLRQQNKLKDCLKYLSHFNLDMPLEIASQEIRFATESLGSLSGRVHVEEILDQIFSDFCIGK